jgi:hypothetical protein
MNPTEKILSTLGFGVSIPGVAWALFILLATGMSNASDEARRDTIVAFPPAVLAFVVSAFALILAYSRGTIRNCAGKAFSGLAISGGTILLIIAAFRTYR